MFTPLPTPQEMAHWDRLTIEEFGLTGKILMENASRDALHVLKKDFGPLKNKSALVFAGSGNNGGDGFALARHLVNHGVKTLILHAKHQHEYTEDSAYHLNLALTMGIPCYYLPNYELDHLPKIDLIVDALLGTGFSGQLRPETQRWIKSINRLGESSYVVSLDIPSGLDGSTGEPRPIAVQATATVTFEEAKLGLFLPPANRYVGKLFVGKIGIPKHIKEAHPTMHVALDANICQLLRTPSPTMHKGDGGHLLILGGSAGLTGAPLLAARAAYRSGAGLVTLASPSQLHTTSAFPEVMTLGLGQTNAWDATCFEELREHLPRFSAVVFGPGLGRTPGAAEFVRAYVQHPHHTTLYDADALYHLAQHQDLLSHLDSRAVLTPHPGEMGTFFHVSSTDINLARASYARKFTTAHNVILVLKGAATIIASPEPPLAISPFCSPNLAIAGSGDVLSGMIGTLLAQEYPPLTAAQLGVYWHGYTGMLLARDFPYRGNTPLEIADYLPLALKEWKHAHCS